MKRTLMTAIVTALVAGAGLASGSASAQSSAPAAAKPKPTPFVFSAAGFATRVVGGGLPASSDRTAFTVLSCTNVAPRMRSNTQVGVLPDELAAVVGAKTTVWSAVSPNHRRGASNAVNKIARVTLPGALSLRAIESRAKAYFDGSTYRTRTTTTLGSIRLAGLPLDVPSPGETLSIPGVAEITVGTKDNATNGRAAISRAGGIRIDLELTGTTIYIGKVKAQIAGDVPNGMFRGSAYATKANVLEGVLISGPTPFNPMPCRGTNGDVRRADLANLNVTGLLRARGLATSLRANQNGSVADAWTKASVARVNIGNGSIIVSGVQGRAHVRYVNGGRVKKDADGTSIGRLRIDGDLVNLPNNGRYVVAGVARFDTHVVTRSRNGIRVTALRITLLDGSLAVVNLGNANAYINPAS